MRRPLLALLALLAVLLSPVARGGNKAEDKAWQGVLAAQGDPAKALQKAEDFLRAWQAGPWEAQAHAVAARAALDTRRWTQAREHAEHALQKGVGDQAGEMKLVAALALVGEGRDGDGAIALQNVIGSEADPQRLGRASRALANLRGRLGKVADALAALDVLAARGPWDAEQDLSVARSLAASLSEEALAAVEASQRLRGGGAVAGLLLLERRGQLTAAAESLPARRGYVLRHPDSPLLDSVPDGRSIAAAPEAGRMALGLLLPLTGKFAQPAELVRRGVESAQRAAQGRGWPVPELVLGDTKGEPEGARLAFRKLAEEAQVSAVIGPMVNAEAEAIAPLADELGVPTLMLVQRPGLALGRSAVWNHWVTAEEQVTGLLDYVIAQLGLTRFAVAYPERQGAAEVVERFWSRVEERGGTVTSVEAFNPDATDYRETARRITGRAYTGGGGDPVLPFLAARQRPQVAPGAAILKPGEDFQAIFVADSYKRVTMLVPGFLYEEINLGGHLPTKDRPPVVLLGGAAFNHRDLVGRGGKYVNGAVLVDGFFARSPDPEVVAFVKDCMDAWKTEPSILEAVGWDLASIVSQALAEGAQGRKGLRAAIPALRPKVKVAGALGFRPDGEMEHQLFVIRVQDGAFTQVWPEPVAMETTPAP